MYPDFMSSRAEMPSVPGLWKVAAGKALTLRPRKTGTLKVLQGSLWLTFDGPHAAEAGNSGDIVMDLGDRLPVKAGQRVIVESLRRGEVSYFDWEPLQ